MPPRSSLPRSRSKRTLGLTLMATAWLGLLISLSGILFVLVTGRVASEALARELAILDRALLVTQEGLQVADGTLTDTQLTIRSLSNTVNSTSRTLVATDPTLTTLRDVTGTSLPKTLDSTNQALKAASESARLVDDVLGTLGFFGLRYEPEVPLSIAIKQVADSLVDLPTALDEVTEGLGTAQDNLRIIADDLEEVAAGLDLIALNLDEAMTVVADYETIVIELRNEVAAVQVSAPFWFVLVQFGLILLLVWLGLAQISLFVQGRQLLAEGQIEQIER
ncbi:hypothetical protein [Candidatus Chloroploca asiatica]|uniref:Uncharacterized protein n=1 Tax=Candidatus Chloroploca asiatica TaxID=1506545 RepID=A0A2H3KN49_9CHLR|nr:hypothetical protein [Candidatus Chloroploca asiatica]PDV96556.1 hypothetical protein A9Q02_06260 [Candidatus Chloroploca asiatica]